MRSQRKRDDKLGAETRTGVAELERAVCKTIPRFWLHAELGRKFDIAESGKCYYRSPWIFKHYPMPEPAKAYPGTLRQIVREASKGISDSTSSTIRFPEATQRMRQLVARSWQRRLDDDHDRVVESFKRVAEGLHRKLSRPSRGLANKAVL